MKKNNIKQTISNDKGITLVTLLITVGVMLLLLSVSVITGLESLHNTRIRGFYLQLETIQKRVDDIATTNESFIDDSGNTIYIKQQGISYDNLTESKQTLLENIISNEGAEYNLNPTNFRYFTIKDLENLLDLTQMEYNVFIDFESRTIIAEKGITVNGKKYNILLSETYFVKQDTTKNEGQITSLNYLVTAYATDKYKVVITPENTIGDIEKTGHVEYKKTITKYWETSTNNEVILELETEYNIKYIDANNNYLEKIIKVELDSQNENQPIVTEIE